MSKKRKGVIIAAIIAAVIVIGLVAYFVIKNNTNNEVKSYRLSEFEALIPNNVVKQEVNYGSEYTLNMQDPENGKNYPITYSVNHFHWFYDEGNSINSKSVYVIIGIDIKNEMRLPLIYDTEPKVFYPGSANDNLISREGSVISNIVVRNDAEVTDGVIKPGQSATVWVIALVSNTTETIRLEPIQGWSMTIDGKINR